MEATFRQPDIADIFERILVPSIFERYARDLVDRARPIGPSDRILDLGCGTGIVARVLAERLGGAARISGLDLSPAMIARARAIAPEVDWHEGNAAQLPFGERAFDLVLSQQMLQFVPDRGAALSEIRRVLAPGGRLLATTWRARSEQPLFEALGVVAEKHLGKPNDKRFGLDAEGLAGELRELGFVDVQCEAVSLVESYREFPVRPSTMAANFDLSAFEPVELEQRFAAIERESADVLARFRENGAITAPSVTNLIRARLPA